MKLTLSEVEKSQENDLWSYQKMVGGFLKAFKSEARRILLTQKPDLDFSELERVTPSDLAKVAAEEETAKKSASKQRKKSKKKATSEKPPFECSLEPSFLPERASTEVGPEIENIVLVPDEQSLIVSADASVLAPESGMDFDI